MNAQLLGLLGGRLGEIGAPVTELAHEQAGQRVEVALALVVVDVGALALDDDRDVRVRVAGEVHPQVVLGGALELVMVVGHGAHGPPLAPQSQVHTSGSVGFLFGLLLNP